MVSDIMGSGDTKPAAINFDDIPKTALQAIYHAVTGKTENLSKDISGNVIINFAHIERLHSMLLDQLALHETIFDPTVTVVVKHDNHKSVTYSSWERFKSLQVNNHEVTSEITLRLELVIRLPQTPTPQRCIVDINLDSSLPVLQKSRTKHDLFRANGFFYFLKQEWNTVSVSIDFVDFLVAK